MLSGLLILHGPGKGPGKLVLVGPPDKVDCKHNVFFNIQFINKATGLTVELKMLGKNNQSIN